MTAMKFYFDNYAFTIQPLYSKLPGMLVMRAAKANKRLINR